MKLGGVKKISSLEHIQKMINAFSWPVEFKNYI
ncbi:MAG: hypothetical protein ACJASH_000780 [Bermanella sp.]